jgi:SAM-dependent methyltransferase
VETSSPIRRRVLDDPATLRTFLLSLDFFGRYLGHPEEGVLYVETHLRRFQRTIALLPPLPPRSRVLDVGALPYYLAILLRREFEFDVTPLSFFEVADAHRPVHVVESPEFGERYEFQFANVNAERDPFPFASASFDLVLLCEILEHLLIDPSHLLSEIHRVLRPGGTLLLSTPNVVRCENLARMVRGDNVYDTYHGNGIYGRHNREYAPGEVRLLLEANSFQVERLELENVYEAPALRRLVSRWLAGRRDTIFARARPEPPRRRGYPWQLYAFMEEYRNVRDSHLVMGENDIGQVGRGWYHLEPGPPPLRWTGREAVAYLRWSPGSQPALGIRLTSHHPEPERTPLAVEVSVNGHRAGRITLGDHAWHTATLPLPPEALGDPLEVVLRVDPTWSPHRARGTADRRELGVAVERIWLEPVDACRAAGR